MIRKKILINTLIRFEKHQELIAELNQLEGFDESTMTIVYDEMDLDICHIIDAIPVRYHSKVKFVADGQ